MTKKEINFIIELLIQSEPEFICDELDGKSDWCKQHCNYPFVQRKCVEEYARRKVNDKL